MYFDAFLIKLIAISTMVVDHVGFFLFPRQLVLRAVGRISFPLFAWLIANGAKHTKDIEAYIKRLLIFAVISQVPYALSYGAIGIEPGLNVLITLTLGLLGIVVLKSKHNKLIKWSLIFLLALVAQIIRAEYGFVGVLSVVFFYVFFHNFKLMLLSQTILYLLRMAEPVISGGGLDTFSLLQPLAIASLFFAGQYNGEEGPKAKYLFYIFYPLHLFIFYLLVIYL